MYRQNKNTAEWMKQIYIIGHFYVRDAGVKSEPLNVDDNIDKKVSERRRNTDSYQSFLDELGINAHIGLRAFSFYTKVRHI